MCEGGGNCLKYLKRGWNRKEGKGHKDFKKGGGGKLGQWVGALKRGWLEPPYELFHVFLGFYCKVLYFGANSMETEDKTFNYVSFRRFLKAAKCFQIEMTQ